VPLPCDVQLLARHTIIRSVVSQSLSNLSNVVLLSSWLVRVFSLGFGDKAVLDASGPEDSSASYVFPLLAQAFHWEYNPSMSKPYVDCNAPSYVDPCWNVSSRESIFWLPYWLRR